MEETQDSDGPLPEGSIQPEASASRQPDDEPGNPAIEQEHSQEPAAAVDGFTDAVNVAEGLEDDDGPTADTAAVEDGGDDMGGDADDTAQQPTEPEGEAEPQSSGDRDTPNDALDEGAPGEAAENQPQDAAPEQGSNDSTSRAAEGEPAADEPSKQEESSNQGEAPRSDADGGEAGQEGDEASGLHVDDALGPGAPEPDTGDAAPEPDASDAAPEPDAGDAAREPDAGDAAPEPDTGDAALEPDAGDAALEPDAGDAAPELDAGDAPLEPDAGDAAPEPDAGDAPPEPDADDAGQPDADDAPEPDVVDVPGADAADGVLDVQPGGEPLLHEGVGDVQPQEAAAADAAEPASGPGAPQEGDAAAAPGGDQAPEPVQREGSDAAPGAEASGVRADEPPPPADEQQEEQPAADAEPEAQDPEQGPEASAPAQDELAPAAEVSTTAPAMEASGPLPSSRVQSRVASASSRPPPPSAPPAAAFEADGDAAAPPPPILATPPPQATYDPAVQFPHSAAPLERLMGLDPYRHHNLQLVDEDVAVTCVANAVVLLRLSTGEQRLLLRGVDGGGVGAVAVHPSRQLLAVAEKARCGAPCIYLYEYPSLQLKKTLHGGTERAYSALAFDAAGAMLASVGGFPDFLLTLWDWQQEAIVLRAKAFSQDVYGVAFSPYFEGQLTTSGQGHIRFWRMAATFTGLKLQGALGKFGNVELSDVAAFVELPDGKVLSSTETGELLLWDGGLIKVVLTCSGGRPCHAGPVEVLLLDRAANVILSAGADGYVRLWDFNQVNEAETGEEGNTAELRPLDEVLLAPGLHVRGLLWERRRWVVMDRAGGVWTVTLPESGPISKGCAIKQVLDVHAGAVAGLAVSPSAHMCMLAGRDGHLRMLDYRSGATVAHVASPAPVTAFAALRPSSAALPPVLLGAVTGHRDGTLRCHVRAADGSLRLTAACKPHTGKVLALALSHAAGIAVTVGEDGTVFFFQLDVMRGTLAPLAFAKLGLTGGAQATCAIWDARNERLLIGTNKGEILKVPLPPADVNTHHSYEVALEIERVSFNAPKPKVPKKKKKKEEQQEGAEGGAAAEGDADKQRDKDAAAGDADGKERAEGEEGEGEEDEEEEEETEAPEDAAAAELLTLQLAPDDPECYLVTVGGGHHAAGQVWRMTPLEPMAVPLGLKGPTAGPITTFVYSANGAHALLGTADGIVRVQPLAGRHGPPSGPYWEAPLHDMQTGRISGVALSFDGAYLVTAGHDGAVHLMSFQLSGPVTPQEPLEPESLPVAEELPARPPDITSPSAYSLEEEKQQAERDQQIREAEEKKLSVRERLARIRNEFEALLAENEAQPEALRLPRSEFEVDPGLREVMEAQAARREEVARLELAWEGEKRRLALAKLRRHFFDDVETERVVLYALRGSSAATTFRTAKLSPATQQELAAIKAAAAEAAALAAGRDSAGGDTRKGGDRAGGVGGLTSMGSDAPAKGGVSGPGGVVGESSVLTGTGGLGSTTGRLPNKADLRRLARKKREAEWAAFKATRPDDSYENPDDVVAIQEAQRTIGDFKLKTDPNFVIPEEERMTPQRKRHAMLLLEDALHGIKAGFNTKFMALRDVKRKVLSDIKAKVARLVDISAQAQGLEDAGAAAQELLAGIATSLRPEEQPESREQVTDEDLAEFAKRKEEEERKAAAGGALGGFATAAGKKATQALPVMAPPTPGASGGSGAGGAAGGGGGGNAPALSAAEEALSKMMAAAPQSELEKALAQYNRRRVEHLRSKLMDEIRQMVEAFDDAHAALKAEKLSLEADVKAGEMRLLVAHQELALLREFDKRESVLLQKRQAKLDDKQEIVDKMTDCTDKLESKRQELEALISRRAAVVAEFDTTVPDTDPFRESLSKIFHRKIKRSKKKGGAGDDDYDSDDGDDDDDDAGDDDADDDDDGSEEVCPPGCDQGAYERVCDLREKRLDEEDMIAEFQKTIEVLRKEKEALAKKQRLVEQGLAAINADMAEFQKEKQRALNQLEVVVSLRMHQIEYLLDGRLPEDLSAALVFSSRQLRRLQARVGELDEERAALKGAQKELRKEHVGLLKDKAAKEQKVAELEARAHDVQMLKFGQEIDLELLDKVSSSKGTEELKEELRKQEIQYAKELAEWDAKIAGRTDELVALTRENTACLNAVSELTAAQRKLEGTLTATRKGLFTDPVQQRKAEVEERDALVQLVNAQAQEIEKLKAQLGALRRKDTSMYA